MNWKIARRLKAHQSGDSRVANPTATPRFPTEGSGPQTRTNVDKIDLVAMIRIIPLTLPYIKGGIEKSSQFLRITNQLHKCGSNMLCRNIRFGQKEILGTN